MKLTVVGGGNMGLTYAKGIDKARLLSEQISILEKYFCESLLNLL